MEMSLDSLHRLLRYNDRLFPIILSAILYFIVKAWLYKFSSSRSSKLRLPPGPKPMPILGNMKQLSRGPIHVVLHHLAKTYGPICQFKLGQISFVSVTSSEAAKEILKNQEPRFAQRPKLPLFEMTRFDRGSMAFAPYGDYWKSVRKICIMELLSPSRVRHFRSLREQETSALIQSIKLTSCLPFSVGEMIFACSNTMISKAVFGRKCKRRDEFMSAVKEQLSLAGMFSLPEAFPSLQIMYHLDGSKAKMRRFRTLYDDVLGSIIADQRINLKSGDPLSSDKETLVDVLLRLQQSDEMGISLSDNTIKDIIFDMLIGGTDTSPTAVEWALSEMLKNPGVMKKAQTELRDALKGKTILEESDLENIQYLKLIIKETFRLHPPAAVLGRVAREDSIVHGYNIPKEARVLINNWSLGRDPDLWENPEKFDPDRFLSSSIDLFGTRFDSLPFGSGRRVCPGAGFAVANIELMLANLIYYFDWKLADGLSPKELDMNEAAGMIVKRLNPLLVVATPRHMTD